MITVNVHEAKTHLSHYLDEVEKGQVIQICKRNRPIAEVRHVPAPLRTERPIGLAKGTFTVPQSFFEELPEEFISQFEASL